MNIGGQARDKGGIRTRWPDVGPPPPRETRGQAESRIRHMAAHAPKFFCSHCQRPGKTLNHIGACARSRRKR